MATIDEIYKALRIVPEFDGNTNVLTRFIKLCDQLVQTYVSQNPGHQLTNLALLNGILNKVTGPAARLINTNGVPETWEGIRSSLINNFSDQRDETSLYNDMALLTQGNSTPQEYYEKCQSLFATIMTYVSLHETIQSTIESKRSLYKKLTLQSYLRGLRDPLGSRIRCMRPDTIEKALEFVHEEMNTLYMQQRNEPQAKKIQPQLPIQPMKPFNPVMSSMPMNVFTSMHKPFNPSMPGPSRANMIMPPQRPQIMWRPNFNQSPQFQGPSRTQQMFSAGPPNFNAFRTQPSFPPKGPNANDTPKPMSGVSHFVSRPMPVRGHDWTKSGNPPPSNYFKSREINLNECYEYPYYELYYDNSYDERNCDYYEQPDYTYYDMSLSMPQQSTCADTHGATSEETQAKVTTPNEENFQKGSNTKESK